MTSTENYTNRVNCKYITQVKIGDSFQTNKAAINYILSGNHPNHPKDSSIIDTLPPYALTAKRRDTHVGGNDAVNSYYQFCENDDVVHPINQVNSDSSGMGRVYNETFDEQQQIMYMSFGVPDFTNAATFIGKAYDTDLAKLMNTGDFSTLNSIGQFLGSTLGTVITLPFLPIKFLGKLLAEASPSKYYDFQPSMALYYKMVNVILAHIAVNMNLSYDSDSGGSPAGIPGILRTHGLDILSILSRKHWYDDMVGSDDLKTDDLVKELQGNVDYEKNIWEKGMDGVKFGLTEALRYVGFRIEKSTDSVETATNSTKEPEILGFINSQVQSAQSRAFNLNTVRETTVGQAVDAVYQGVSGVISGIAQSVSLTGGVEVLKGSGFVDIPEVWASSSFSKNYSFDFQLRTPYGDPFSIFYSLYIPLALLMAGAFPRSVGQNAYTSPFLVRAYCQGMFAIPLGVIDSITIRRGAQEYGWTQASGNMLPTQIDVSITIKDLSPIMHIALADGGMKEWMNVLGQNSSFQEYMLTLSGANIAQRTLKLQLAKKRIATLTKIAVNNKLNPMMFGFSLTNTALGRALTTLTPISRLPGSESTTFIPRP